MQTVDLATAKHRADAGIERAADKAERISEGWIETATEDLRRYAQQACDDFTIEQARVRCRPAPEGADSRAWGAITRRAKTLGYIEQVPGRYAAAFSSNGSPKPVYRRGPRA